MPEINQLTFENRFGIEDPYNTLSQGVGQALEPEKVTFGYHHTITREPIIHLMGNVIDFE